MLGITPQSLHPSNSPALKAEGVVVPIAYCSSCDISIGCLWGAICVLLCVLQLFIVGVMHVVRFACYVCLLYEGL